MVRFVWVIVVCLCLTACGGKTVKAPIIKQSLADSMVQYFQSVGAPPSSQYLTHMNDLNGDGEQDAIILIRSPFGYWCNTNGCPMFVAIGTPSGYDVISKTHPVRGPVCVLNTATGTWRDIVVRVAGRTARPKEVMLQNKGNGYPADPDQLTPIASGFEGQSVCAFQTENGASYARTHQPRMMDMQSMSVNTQYNTPHRPQYDIGRRPPPYDPNYIPEMKEPIGHDPFVNEYDPANR